MDRRRGEARNWYTLPIEERARQMNEHGLVGRRYAGEVRQIITGSIGFDDWEWGVDLFADDPLVFKKLIYEMRFDEVSAVYALFGQFYLGVRVPGSRLGQAFERGVAGEAHLTAKFAKTQTLRNAREHKVFLCALCGTLCDLCGNLLILEHKWRP